MCSSSSLCLSHLPSSPSSIPLSNLPPALSSFSTSRLKQIEVVLDPYEKPLPSFSVTSEVIVLFIFVIRFEILNRKSKNSVIFSTASTVTSIPHHHHPCYFLIPVTPYYILISPYLSFSLPTSAILSYLILSYLILHNRIGVRRSSFFFRFYPFEFQ